MPLISAVLGLTGLVLLAIAGIVLVGYLRALQLTNDDNHDHDHTETESSERKQS